jgi:hypothetical protein
VKSETESETPKLIAKAGSQLSRFGWQLTRHRLTAAEISRRAKEAGKLGGRPRKTA